MYPLEFATPNCTLVELKYKTKDHRRWAHCPPNCTLVELKYNQNPTPELPDPLQIVP